MLVVSMVAVSYLLYRLNKWFEETKRKINSKNNGQVPATNIDLNDIVDYSCKTELYCEDGVSGLLDIKNKYTKVQQEYELVDYELEQKKKPTSNDSFFSNFANKTSDESELHGFDFENDYEVAPRSYRIGGVRIDLPGNRESLL